MKKKLIIACAVVAFLCFGWFISEQGKADREAASAKDTTPTAVETPTPEVTTTTVEPTPEPTTTEPTTRVGADENGYLETLSYLNPMFASVDEETSLLAGYAVCDLYDSLGVPATVDFYSSQSEDTQSIAIYVLPVSASYLCPEHFDDLNTYLESVTE